MFTKIKHTGKGGTVLQGEKRGVTIRVKCKWIRMVQLFSKFCHCYITFGFDIMHIHLDPVVDVDEDDAPTTYPYRAVAPVYCIRKVPGQD
jgi:hypothetical protein